MVATANVVTALPSELMRIGRFDEVFFADLPDQSVREAIVLMHLTRREQEIKDINISALSELYEVFSGTEIEQLVVSATYHTYAKNVQVDTQLLQDLIEATQPLSILMRERIDAPHSWARERAVPV